MQWREWATHANSMLQSKTMLRSEVLPTQSSKLLALPAELRGKIFELCLLSEDKVTVTSGFKPPCVLLMPSGCFVASILRNVNRALLSTCRQIRTETRSMFWLKNTFLFTIYDCDDSLAVAFRKVLNVFLPVMCDVICTLKGRKSWENLMKWCRNAHANKSFFLDRLDDRSQLVSVVVAALKITKAVNSWSECERALEGLRVVAEAIDSEWRGKVAD